MISELLQDKDYLEIKVKMQEEEEEGVSLEYRAGQLPPALCSAGWEGSPDNQLRCLPTGGGSHLIYLSLKPGSKSVSVSSIGDKVDLQLQPG